MVNGEVAVTIVTALKVTQTLGMTLADLFSELKGNQEGTSGG